jgi:tetratricopeptide (TPR) repeat protein
MSLNNLAGVLFRMGAYPQAKPLYERALTIHEKALGPDHLNLADPLTGLGRTEVRLHQLQTAVPRLQRSLALYEKVRGASAPVLSEPLLGLAEVQLARKQPAEAVALLERALRLDDDPNARAGLQLTLAEALWALGHDRARGRRLAEEARAAYASSGHQPGLAQATRWLAEHPGEGLAKAEANAATAAP